MYNQQVSGLKVSFQNLLPSCKVKEQYLSKSVFFDKYEIPEKLKSMNFGCIAKAEIILLWLKLEENLFGILKIERDIAFTKDERKFLNHFTFTISGLLVTSSSRLDKLTGRISSWYSFETILVAKYLRKYKTLNFWTPAIIVNQLQLLTSEKYENKPCSSGFIFVSRADEFLTKFNYDIYTFEKFNNTIILDEEFFSSPASYRYVDGKNSFYVVDNWQKIIGILRIKDPRKFSIIERLSNQHIFPLFETRSFSRIWVGFVGMNNDIKIIVSKSIFFTWLKTHWHFIDLKLFTTILTDLGVELSVADKVISSLICLSNLRLGTLILFPNSNENLPETVGKIDYSLLGKELYGSMKDSSIDILINNNVAIGMLTSDGITIISKKGEIIDTGTIIGVKSDANQNKGGAELKQRLKLQNMVLPLKCQKMVLYQYSIIKKRSLDLIIK